LIAEEIEHGESGHFTVLRRRVSRWPATKAKRVLTTLEDWPQYRFAWHDKEEIGGAMLAEIAKNTGLRPKDV
jgi:hypothetical protein